VRIAYKVCWKNASGVLRSTSRAGLIYELDKVVEAPTYLLREGYGVLAFDTLKHAAEFCANIYSYQILLVNRIDPMDLPPHCSSVNHIPSNFSDFITSWDVATRINVWPFGTLMSRAVEVLEVIPWR